MSNQRNDLWSRREFLGTAALAGTGALLGLRSDSLAAEPQPETPKIRLIQRTDAICTSPQFVAGDLLRGEGFTEVEYVKTTGGNEAEKALVSGEANLSMQFSVRLILGLDKGHPIVIIGGGPRRLLRIVRLQRRPRHSRPQGKDRGGAGERIYTWTPAPHHARTCRSRPAKGRQVGRT